MKNSNFWIVLKVLMLTWVFFVIINYSGYLLNAQKEPTIETQKVDSWNENISTYVNKNIEVMWNIWVAVSTNIWTRHKQTNDIPVEITQENVNIWAIVSSNQVINDKIITPNMVFIFEYLNILKTDVRSLLSSSTDRSFALNSFIAQLEYRYKESAKYSQSLALYRAELVKKFNDNERKINELKDKISQDFTKFNTTQTTKNIDDFLELKQKSNNYRTYIVFIDKFLNFYAQLNNYNKWLLDVLINNKDALVKNSHVVIPNNWANLLRELNLIYDEAEFKK